MTSSTKGKVIRNKPRSMNRDALVCDECENETTRRRARFVVGFTSGGSHHDARQSDLVFCPDCHRKVFRECDWRKYPQLFEERHEWPDGLIEGKWYTSAELAEFCGMDARGVGRMVQASGHFMGFKVNRDKPNSAMSCIYQVFKDLA